MIFLSLQNEPTFGPLLKENVPYISGSGEKSRLGCPTKI